MDDGYSKVVSIDIGFSKETGDPVCVFYNLPCMNLFSSLLIIVRLS